MSDLHPIKPGDRLPTKATTWNAMLAAARANQYGTPSQTDGGPGGLRANEIYIYNPTASEMQTYDVVGLGNPFYLPSGSNAYFYTNPIILRAATSIDETNHRGKIAILQEPIRSGWIGRAVIDGFSLAKLVVGPDGAGSTFCQIVHGDGTHLLTSNTGDIPIAYQSSVATPDFPGFNMGIVRLGHHDRLPDMPDDETGTYVLEYDSNLREFRWMSSNNCSGA